MVRLMKVPCPRLAHPPCLLPRFHTSPLRHLSWRFRASNSGENSESVSRQLSEDEARQILGISKETPFEQVVKIKNKLLISSPTDEYKKDIQTAYDLLLMKSMVKRVQSSEEVPNDVRYADVKKLDLTKEARNVISRIPTGGLAIENPTPDVLRINSIAFGLLAIYILPQGFSEASLNYDSVPGIQLAFAFAWSIYSYRQYKLLGFGRSVGYTLSGLVVGALLGGAVEGLIHVHDHPLGGFHSPAALISEFSVIGMWACAVFLR